MNRYRAQLVTKPPTRMKNPLLRNNGLVPEDYRMRYKYAVETMRSIQAPAHQQIVELELMVGEEEGGD